MEITQVIIIAGIAIIAFFYSSTGYGGATGYLALMALMGVSPFVMKPSALVMNIFVSSIAFLSYYRAGYFRLNLVLPFVAASVPMAFLGGRITPGVPVYEAILGVLLVISAFRIIYKPREPEEVKRPSFSFSVLSGALIGFFSGMVGIGGGILLAPLMILMKWAKVKEAAAAASIFILLNSLAGLAGFYGTPVTLSPQIYSWTLTAVTAAIAGSHCGSMRFSVPWLKIILSCVIVAAGMKLIF